MTYLAGCKEETDEGECGERATFEHRLCNAHALASLQSENAELKQVVREMAEELRKVSSQLDGQHYEDCATQSSDFDDQDGEEYEWCDCPAGRDHLSSHAVLAKHSKIIEGLK